VSIPTELSSVLDRSRLHEGVVLAPFTSFRIGGPADYFYEATTADDLARAVTAARDRSIPWFVLGLGANILVGDRGFRGIVIRNRAAKFSLSSDGVLHSETGAVVGDLIHESVAAGWSGLEHYIGIPSTVGGAIWQNLHFLSPAPERERTMFIEEVFARAELLTETGARMAVDRQQMRFGYDTSILHGGSLIALTATFQLERGDVDSMQRVMQENLSWRGSRHPWLEHHPSAGSIFKKIEGVGAGRLVDQCGLKGFTIGDAQISHMHANIIINRGKAKASDVRSIISHAQAEVEKKFSVRLEPEIAFVGEF
jgi:UDP-N-acetylmuramate dehydrogenase